MRKSLRTSLPGDYSIQQESSKVNRIQDFVAAKRKQQSVGEALEAAIERLTFP